MDIAEVREYALSLPLVDESTPFGPDILTLKIGGRMFCMLDMSCRADYYTMKVDPDLSVELRERYDFIRPGYHMNKKHWISVDFRNSFSRSEEQDLIYHSYQCTIKALPLKIRRELGLE